MNVPVFDLGRAVRRIESPLGDRWRRLLASSAFVLGPETRELEAAFAAYLGAAGCVGVANGTDALTLAVRALGVGAGDEVIVPAFSFFATAEAVLLAGGRPVFADVEPATFNLDLGAAAALVGRRTVGIIAVHLYGRPFDADAASALCDHHGLWLLEDAAQAHGAAWGGRRAGTLGRLAAWSFYPTKNLGCFGDGGAITGGDLDLLESVRRLANHGQDRRYHHVAIGTNSRLDSLQAAVLNCRLPLLEADNERRRVIAARYRRLLAGVGDLRFPDDPPAAVCVYHQLAVRTARRDLLMAYLTQRGIGTAIHYPEPIPRQPALSAAYPEAAELPVAATAAAELLCLPMFPELRDEEVEAVCAAVADFFGQRGEG